MTAYADTSAMVSLYVPDAHSRTAMGWMREGVRVWFSPLHWAECCHAVAQQVFHGKVSAADAAKVFDHLSHDRRSGLWVETGIPDNAFELCADVARRYGPKIGVRTLDSLHVACAVELGAEYFWTFDERQAKLAKVVGLKTL